MSANLALIRSRAGVADHLPTPDGIAGEARTAFGGHAEKPGVP